MAEPSSPQRPEGLYNLKPHRVLPEDSFLEELRSHNSDRGQATYKSSHAPSYLQNEVLTPQLQTQALPCASRGL